MAASFLSTVLVALFQGVASYISLWMEKQKHERDAWNAVSYKAQLDSVRIAESQRFRIKAAGEMKPPQSTPATWNTHTATRVGSLFSLAILLLCLTGCKTVFVKAEMPLIEAPPRPVLPDAGAAWTHRESLLVSYAESLERVIAEYNAIAREANEANGYASHVPPDP